MSRLAVLAQIKKPRHIPFQSRLAISERRLLLVTGDIALIIGSIVGALAIWARWADRTVSWPEQTFWAIWVFSGWLLLLIAQRLYDLQMAVSFGTCARRIVVSGASIGLAYLILFFFTSPAPLGFIPLQPRIAPTLAILSSTLLLTLWRLAYARLLGGPQARRRLLILGAGKSGQTLNETIQERHSAHYLVLGFVDDDPAKQYTSIDQVPVIGDHEDLPTLATRYAAHEIALAISADVRGRLFQSIMDCHERGITITPMPLLYERLTGRIAVEHIGSQWYIALPLQDRPNGTLFQVCKRISDIVLGVLGTIVFALVTPIVALLIRLDSPGPIFYMQERAGRSGRPFRVRKFRSMIENAEAAGGAQWATKDDDRITRVGRVLRKTRLDELPQLINVLRGEMSLIGPRPERPEFITQLQHQIPFYRTRLSVKPGLTGWAQVNYGYGSSAEDALIKLQYDLYYIKHQSIWLDMLILLRTIGVVVRMKGQ